MSARTVEPIVELVDRDAVYVCDLTLSRIQGHYSNIAHWRDVLPVLRGGTEVTPSAARLVLGRSDKADVTRFFATSDRTGLFIAIPSASARVRDGIRLVSFISLTPTQTRVLARVLGDSDG